MQDQYIAFGWWHLPLMPWWCLTSEGTFQLESCREAGHTSYPLLACKLMHTPSDLVQLESLHILERWPQDPVTVDCTKQVHPVEMASTCLQACLQASYSSLRSLCVPTTSVFECLPSPFDGHEWIVWTQHWSICSSLWIRLTTEFPVFIKILNHWVFI